MSGASARTRLRPIIRVFVSSTFSDLKLERDALQQRVFPKLERLCQNDGFQFQAIDLRWGVPTEAGLHHRTMRICFEELRRSQEISPEPNFLILLGNRYGWRPLPEEISAEEFQRLEDSARQIDMVDQRQPVDVLRQWYLLDENSLTPAYILQPRRKPRDDDPDRTDYTTLEAWRPVEETLWKIINHNQAFPPDELRNRFQFPPSYEETPPSIVRFQASATEQEIWAGALSVPNADRHVRAFFRHINNRDDFSPTEVKDFFDVTEAEEFDGGSKMAQEELKGAIRSRLGDNAVLPIPFAQLKRHEGNLVIHATEEVIQSFCDDVERALKEVLERQIREYWEPEASDAPNGESLSDQRMARELEIERDEHLRFGKERGSSDFFVGRDENDGPLARIQDYLAGDSRFPMVIHGESGCGKTALLARAFEMIPEARQPMIRFLGVTPRSSDVRSLLSSLCQELRGRNKIPEPFPADIQELTQQLRQHLEAATAEKPVILFLDALDQLSDADDGRQLFWFPYGELPAHTKLIVSCLSDRQVDDPVGLPYRSLQGRALPAENWLNLEALSPDDAKTLLFDRWLAGAGRKVTEAQRQLIESRLASSATCRQPLYLKLLVEEAKLWRSWDNPTQPGGNVEELLKQLIARLSAEAIHGPLLVERVLGYLAASRLGLSETEILELLFEDSDYHAELHNFSKNTGHILPEKPRRIPVAIWSRLRFDLAPYLSERSAPDVHVLTLYHREVAEWVKVHSVHEAKWTPHDRLAAFFRNQADPEKDGKWTGSFARPYLELPFHLANVPQWEHLASTLSNVRFVIAKLSFGLSFELIQDFDTVLAGSRLDLGTLQALKQLRHVVWCQADVLRRFPTLAQQQVVLGLGGFASLDPGLAHQDSVLTEEARASGRPLAEVVVPEFVAERSGRGLGGAVDAMVRTSRGVLVWKTGGQWIEFGVNGAPVAEGQGPIAPISVLAQSNGCLAAASAQFVLLWQLWPAGPPRPLQHDSTVERITFSSDGCRLLVVGQGGSWCNYRRPKEASAWKIEERGNITGSVIGAWYDPQGNPVFATADGLLKWGHNGAGHIQLTSVDPVYAICDESQSNVFLALADRTAASVAMSGEVRWSVALPAQARHLSLTTVSASQRLLAALADGSIWTCDAATGTDVTHRPVSTHSLTVITELGDEHAIVRDYIGDAILVWLNLGDPLLSARALPAKGRVRAIHWYSNDHELALAAVDESGVRVAISRANTTWHLRSLPKVASPTGTSDFLADGRLVTVRSVLSNNEIYLHDGRHSAAVWPGPAFATEPFLTISEMAFSPDGAHGVFSIQRPGVGGVSLRLIETAQWRELQRFEFPHDEVCRAAPSNGLRRVLFGFKKLMTPPVLWENGEIEKLPIEGGTKPTNIEAGYGRSLADLAISADGRHYLAIDRHGDLWEFDHPESKPASHRKIGSDKMACDLSADARIAAILSGRRFFEILSLPPFGEPRHLCDFIAPWDVELFKIVPDSQLVLLAGCGAVCAYSFPIVS